MRKSLEKIKDPSLKKRIRRKLSIRSKLSGTSERPRLCAIKTNKHLSVQVIDDVKSITLFSLQTFGKNAVTDAASTVNGAKNFGVRLAAELKQRGYNTVVFDRNGRAYTGVIKSLVDSIRENGIAV